MKKTNNTNCTMSNTNTNNNMENKLHYHIVLRDNHNALIDWKGYEFLSDAMDAFLALFDKMQDITEGEFTFATDTKYLTFYHESGYRVELVPTTDKLLFEILFGNHRILSQLFADCLDGTI